MIIAFWILVAAVALLGLLSLAAAVRWFISKWQEWRWERSHRHLCPGCGNDARVGAHGMSEYGGCV